MQACEIDAREAPHLHERHGQRIAMAICAVVEVVGARCRMQASSSTLTSRWISEFFASADSGLPVIDTSLLPLEWMKGTIFRISSVSPE